MFRFSILKVLWFFFNLVFASLRVRLLRRLALMLLRWLEMGLLCWPVGEMDCPYCKQLLIIFKILNVFIFTYSF